MKTKQSEIQKSRSLFKGQAAGNDVDEPEETACVDQIGRVGKPLEDSLLQPTVMYCRCKSLENFKPMSTGQDFLRESLAAAWSEVERGDFPEVLNVAVQNEPIGMLMLKISVRGPNFVLPIEDLRGVRKLSRPGVWLRPACSRVASGSWLGLIRAVFQHLHIFEGNQSLQHHLFEVRQQVLYLLVRIDNLNHHRQIHRKP